MISVVLLGFCALCQCEMHLTSCVTVDFLGINPCCSELKSCSLIKNDIMRFFHIVSRILYVTDVRETGLQFSALDFEPFLYIGQTIADFQASGN